MWLIFLLLEAGLCLLNDSAINSQRTLSKQVFCTYFTREGYYSSYYSSVPPSDYTVSLNVDISSLKYVIFLHVVQTCITIFWTKQYKHQHSWIVPSHFLLHL